MSTWTFDNSHSSVTFAVKHLMVSTVRGSFQRFTGRLELDPANPELASVQASIETASVDTDWDQRDKHLKSPDFFNAKEFPAMTFKSTKGTQTAPGTWEICGQLTMHGQTHEACATVTMTGSADMGRGPKAGFEATFTMKRSQWGMTYGVDKGSLGDEVRVIVALEAGKAS